MVKILECLQIYSWSFSLLDLKQKQLENPYHSHYIVDYILREYIVKARDSNNENGFVSNVEYLAVAHHCLN